MSQIKSLVKQDAKLSEDWQLLRRYAEEQDADAFRRLARRYLDFVYTVCRRDLRNPQSAEDATQETFIALAKQASRLRADTVLPSWLFTVALNQCREIRRRESRHRRVESSEALAPDDNLKGIELQLALETLTASDREVIILRVLMEYSHSEVAQLLGISEDAARMRADRAVKRLRERSGIAGAFLWPLVHAPFEPSQIALPLRSAPRINPVWIGAGFLVITTGVWQAPSVFKALNGSGDTVSSSVAASNAPLNMTPAATAETELLPMHAKVEITIDGQKAFSGETWRTPAITRWRQSSNMGTVEAEIRDGVVRSISLGIDFGPSEGGIVVANASRRVVEIDAFEAALLELPVYIYATPPLPVVRLPKPEFENAVTVQSNGRIYQVWFDANYQSRAIKVDYKFGQHHNVTTVNRWQSVDGVVVPAALTQEISYAGSKPTIRKISITDVKFGAAAAAPPAMPKPKHGSLVMDERRSVIYRVDENWKRISDEQKVGNGNIGG